MTSGRLLLCFAALVVVLAQARAAPLNAEACAKLIGEHEQLELAGVEANMAKGPDSPKLGLAPAQLEQIRRYIEIEEQLLFRCRDKSLVKLAPEPDPGSTEANENDKDVPKAAAPPPAKNTKAPSAATKKKTEPAKKGPVGTTKQDPGAAKSKPPAKAAVKPAPKPDDPPAKQ